MSSSASKGLRALRLCLALLPLGVLLGSGCSRNSAAQTEQTEPSASAAAPAPSVATAEVDASAPPDSMTEPTGPEANFPKANTEGCPGGMVRVTGNYCPAMVQTCKEHHAEYANAKDKAKVSERCLQYEEPSKCISKERTPLDFCMDRFEYPNQVGELPRVLTSWQQAKKLCADQGKRLCTEDEFNFACEGEEGKPHVWGYNRTDEHCNMDKPYRMPDHTRQMKTYDRCYQDERCKAEMDRLDQRHRIGERLTCVSWAGVVDMNGNVNEWVELPGKQYPDRSGLKGGWWGPVRNRCRPTVTFHKEEDYGYEAGFRCCAEVGAETKPIDAGAPSAPAADAAPAAQPSAN
ncbi:MAG: SUMF1/EgtB/PvdO family nonheme iron enzyme [Polyangiaceae bacterium]|nr:SUMF1/EgtB/PvdO family nonheme iron enzyme [Polyangiaceae bacterium]MCW5789394.1 SUMF1/EgtB/PvdO family nonheme iron enzyme [Polyangiaceae bacterium]